MDDNNELVELQLLVNELEIKLMQAEKVAKSVISIARPGDLVIINTTSTFDVYESHNIIESLKQNYPGFLFLICGPDFQIRIDNNEL